MTKLLEALNKKYDKLQKIYGDSNLDSIYNGGCANNPDICFVFMNPTSRNIASSKAWHGLKSPWIGTKNIWDLFYNINLVDEPIYREIKNRKPKDWDEEFANQVYENVKTNKYFITNLGKCTMDNARPLPDKVYKEYLKLLYKEISIIQPKVIILFGNQVSSIVLNEKISVGESRKKTYSVYYPVGNGRFNIDKSIEDILWIMEKENIKKVGT